MRRWSYLTLRGNHRRLQGIVQRPLGVLPRAVCFVASLVTPILVLHVVLYAGEVRETQAQAIVLVPPLSGLRIGERLSFHGRWFGIPVGKGWIEVKETVTVGGRRAYHVEAQGHSNEVLSMIYPVQDVIHSYIDVETLQPLRFEKSQREGHYRAEEVVTFDYTRLVANYRSLLNQSVKEIPIPPTIHDIVSAFYWLRTHPVEANQSILLEVYSDEKVYRTEIKLLRTVMLELLWRGTFPCLVVEPIAAFKGVFVKRGRMWVYVSVDERRLPLFVKLQTPWGPMTGVIDPESLLPLPSQTGQGSEGSQPQRAHAVSDPTGP